MLLIEHFEVLWACSAFKDNPNQFLAHMHNINSIFQLILEILDFQESYNLITICSFLTITQNLELFPTRKLRWEFKNYKSSLARIFSRKSKYNFSKKKKKIKQKNKQETNKQNVLFYEALFGRNTRKK